MLLSAEKWRKDFGIEDMMKWVLSSKPLIANFLTLSALRNFDFKEKAEVDKYYPQFYHKTDKVRSESIRR